LPRWPTLLITLVLGALLVWLWPSMFGHVQLVSAFTGKLPPFSPLPLDLDLILRLLPSAVAVGMLGLVTSLSIARSSRHVRSNYSTPIRKSAPRACRTSSGRFFPDRCQPVRSPVRA
jgi:MFS superfamily sulfate permease-like transporter